ncbi:hypothetical protein [Haloechinothrix salitolerans]|uniref:Uncharacterized protein n=1 Tax=Haloechinothrix salitolerans TaxID=926830 RepID=A0ABW2BYA4_9PSEU
MTKPQNDDDAVAEPVPGPEPTTFFDTWYDPEITGYEEKGSRPSGIERRG